MKALDNMSIIAETRQQLRLEEACRERLANIAQSDNKSSHPLIRLIHVFQRRSNRSAASVEQPTFIRRIFHFATPR